jgi:hypothetical protein
MAELHIKVICFKIFKETISKFRCPKLRENMTNLCSLMGLHFIEGSTVYGYDSGYFDKGSYALINEAVKLLLTKLRPQILPLVELWGVRDSEIVSAIGNSYGDIYETHLKWAQTSRLNNDSGSIPDGFMEYIMPILQGKL